eukprot:5377508-Amphidinium_carterae.1
MGESVVVDMYMCTCNTIATAGCTAAGTTSSGATFASSRSSSKGTEEIERLQFLKQEECSFWRWRGLSE